MWTNPQKTADLIPFTEEILNEKLHFSCVAPSNLVIHILLFNESNFFL